MALIYATPLGDATGEEGERGGPRSDPGWGSTGSGIVMLVDNQHEETSNCY